MISGLNVHIDESAKIDPSSVIKGKNVWIGKNVVIERGCQLIVANDLRIDYATTIKHDFKAKCRTLHIGHNNYILEHVWIEGSLNAFDLSCVMGYGNLICQNTRINCNNKVTIGNEVVIGQNCEVWTHASALNPLKGFPFHNAPVTVGDRVWLMANSTVIAGVTIGNDVLIGNYSFVNKDVPQGSFVAGIPARMIEPKGTYPKNIGLHGEGPIYWMLRRICDDYEKLAETKGFKPNVSPIIEDDQCVHGIRFQIEGSDDKVWFNLDKRIIIGMQNEYVEDFRDYLRHRGIKFFTEQPFKSIMPQDFQDVIL